MFPAAAGYDPKSPKLNLTLQTNSESRQPVSGISSAAAKQLSRGFVRRNMMKTASKAIGVLVSAATLAASVPAQARGYDRRDGIDAGDVIAGALIIGGIAAIASASNRNDRYYRDTDWRRGRDYGYNGYYRDGYSSREAVDQCIRAAQREASRYGRARITDVTDIDRNRGGYEVRGRLVVEQRGYRGGDWDRYGYHYDRYNDGYDKGKFRCQTRYGQVDGVRISGIDNDRGYSYNDYHNRW